MEKMSIEEIKKVYIAYGISENEIVDEVQDFPLPNYLASDISNEAGPLTNSTEYATSIKFY